MLILMILCVVLSTSLAYTEIARRSEQLRADDYERALKASRCKCERLSRSLDSYKDKDNVVALRHDYSIRRLS